jgi:hypothetical protein
MRLAVQKLEVRDSEQMQSIVVENIDGIEPGLTVLDSQQLLGHASIDVVALDANGALVLMTVGLTADEDMLLKAVEAYSWCLEYPDAIRRLYPAAQLSAAQPPRLVFVIERMPEAFHRKIKQLAVPEVDCVEFRYLDVDGTPAAYFDTIARLRRGSVFVEPIARRVAEVPAIEKAAEKVVSLTSPGMRATSVRLQKLLNNGDAKIARSERPAQVVSMPSRAVAPSPVEPALVVETPRAETLTLEAPTFEAPTIVPTPIEVTPIAPIEAVAIAPVVVAAPAVAIAEEVAVATVATLEPLAPVAAPAVETIERVSLRDAMAVTESPVTHVRLATPEPTVEPVAVAEPAAPRRISFADLAQELLGGPPLSMAAEKPAVEGAVAIAEPEPAATSCEPVPAVVAPEPQLSVVAETVIAPSAPEPVIAAVEETELAKAAEALIAAAAEPIAIPEPVAAPAAAAAPVVETAAAPPATVFAKPASTSRTFRPAPKPAAVQAPAAPVTPVVPAAPVAPAPAAAAPAAAAKIEGLPQEFQGLNFPNDGVLTRQWMEFLNQIAAAK